MVWPFLTIYMRERLQAPLSTITLLLTLNGVMGIAATFIAGPIVDRFGRKGPMLVSLMANSAISTTPSRLWQFGMEGWSWHCWRLPVLA
jgi:MFS family permease